jgi:hypothetical protein
MSTFTEDFPYVDISKNIRLGYKLPFKTILPAYIRNTKFFADFFDAIDQVFDSKVYSAINSVKNIRNMWMSNPALEQKIIDSEELIKLTDWTIPEQATVVNQLNLLGLRLGETAGLFTTQNYLAFCRFIGQYWFEKGTANFMDFVNFCCGTQYELTNLWTKDYQHFYKEGDEEIGTPIWEGGEWYPTTHVSFVSTNNYGADVQLLAVLFNEISNYNLVLDTIEQVFDFKPPTPPGVDEEGNPLPPDPEWEEAMEHPQENGILAIGFGMWFNEELRVGYRQVLDINRDILGFEHQNLGQLDYVPFADEDKFYEEPEVFGFEGQNQGNFSEYPFAD